MFIVFVRNGNSIKQSHSKTVTMSLYPRPPETQGGRKKLVRTEWKRHKKKWDIYIENSKHVVTKIASEKLKFTCYNWEKGSEILSVIKSLSQSILDCNPLVYEMLTVLVIILGIQFLGTLGIAFKLFAEHSNTRLQIMKRVPRSWLPDQSVSLQYCWRCKQSTKVLFPEAESAAKSPRKS